MEIKNGFIVGIITIIIGNIVGFVLSNIFPNNLPKVCKTWNKNHIMELSLFLTGFILYILSKQYNLT